MNINRLHQSSNGRQSGRTYQMLVEVVQHADFDVPEVVVVARTVADTQHMLNMAIDIAREMGFYVEPPLRDMELQIQRTTIRFVLIKELLYGSEARVFYDHDCKEQG